ncbi:MAG: rhamnulokinase [Anaerovoracaceae bacterium]|jgi:rhamnulokinase
MKYFMAIDIGASSGRHILGAVENGKLQLEEIYRFENANTGEGGSLCWDIDRLRKEVLAGIRQAKTIGKVPVSVAIDTWGCDYVLLDPSGEVLDPVYAYRDARTLKVLDEAEERMPFRELYRRTGIQKQNFNTVYQLFSDVVSGKLDKAGRFLMIPDYLSYILTGNAVNEYTNATTTSMVSARTGTWDAEIFRAFDIPERLFTEPAMPGTFVGRFTEEIRKYAGYDADVVLAPSHDTASAVAACPLTDGTVYLSSGTWSLIGVENPEPVITEQSQAFNFTNEGGVEHRFRYLKNIMGTWILQNIRKDLDKKYSFPDLIAMAESTDSFTEFDVNDELLLAPENMILAVRTMIRDPDAGLPEVLNSVYHSLGRAYADAVREIEETSGRTPKQILIVGGGSQDRYLNRMTSLYTGLPVLTGIKEATAVGNLLSQIMYADGLSLTEARNIIKNTFTMEKEEIA